MRTKLLWMVLGTAIIGAAAYVANVQATPASGFTGTTLAVGRFGDIEASNHLIQSGEPARRLPKNVWLSFQKTKGASDLYVQSNVWAPGGTTGWLTHPGHSLIIVTAGTVTTYERHNPSRKPHVYTTGMGFVDEGGDHVHVIRNEDKVEARTVAVQLIPGRRNQTHRCAWQHRVPILIGKRDALPVTSGIGRHTRRRSGQF